MSGALLCNLGVPAGSQRQLLAKKSSSEAKVVVKSDCLHSAAAVATAVFGARTCFLGASVFNFYLKS